MLVMGLKECHVTELRQLQENFQHYLLQESVVIKNQIINTTKVPAIERLDIYREAYYLRLIDVLKQDYAALCGLMGDDEFNKLACHYIDAHPSPFRSIRWFGGQLAEFVQKTKPYSAKLILAEMAKFEWLLAEVFDERDSDIVTLEKMATIPFEKWPSMCFELHSSFRRLNFSWSVVPIWKAIKAGKKIPQAQQVDLPVDWMLWRKELEVQFCSLQADEAYMLDAIAAGENFGSICAGLCEWIDEEKVALHAATLLKRFIVDGLIAKLF